MLDFNGEIKKEEKRIKTLEHMLGKGLMQPFNSANSGSRKIMQAIQLEHALPLFDPELPIIETGYENRFGEYSSSIIESDSDYRVIKKISKFSRVPDDHYFLIIRDIHTDEIDILERKSYNHTTESYGYLYNNTNVDKLNEGSTINKGELLRSSLAYDEYGNRCDGVNLLTAYIATDKTMEDGIRISKSGADKLSSPLLKKVTINLGENNILLNLYGNDEYHKSIPEIGEEVKNGIICAVRTEKTDNSLFTQTKENLKKIMMSDDKYTIGEGKIVDIDIYCNNPNFLSDRYTNQQIYYYYQDKLRFLNEIVDSVDALIAQGYTSFSYELQKMYYVCKNELSGKQYIKDRVFSGAIIDIIVLEKKKLKIGDKITNRYGGKGVISDIVPDELMPMTDSGERIELSMNSATCINRENLGQLMESSLTHIGSRIVEFIKMNVLTVDESIDLILRYIRYSSETQSNALKKMLDNCDDELKKSFVDSILDDGYIALSNRPISESMTIDRLSQMYDEFPFATQYEMKSPIKDSNGNIRYVKGRRPLVCGKLYIYRLKQYAEEKFSATSLSSTNIKNENARSKASKNFRSIHSNTPIKFGNMEAGDMGHLGMEVVIEALMLYSVSPLGRRLTEQLLTGDPYNVNIKLDNNSSNRNVEILNTYFKTIGLRLVFNKIKKKRIRPITIKPMYYDYKPSELIKPLLKVSDEEKYDPIEYMKKLQELRDTDLKRPILHRPFIYEGETGFDHI